MNDKNSRTSAINDDLEPQLEAAVLAVLSEPISASAIERVKSQAMTLDDEPRQNVRALTLAGPSNRRWFSSLAITAIAIAASMMVAASLFLIPPSAFAQVVVRIKQMKTAKFTLEFTGGDQSTNFVALAIAKSPDRLRFDFQLPSQAVNITNGAAGELISYDANSDQVTVNAIPKAHAGFDILHQLQNADVKAVAIDAENFVEGTDLYSIFDGRGRVWVDKNTKLPQRIEVTSPEALGSTKLVYRDFQWDVPVDDRLFLLPVGRTIVRSSLLAEPTEAELIAAFQIRQAFSQEPYDASYLADKEDKVGLRLGQLAYDLSKNQVENAELQSAKLHDHWTKIGISVSESRDSKLVQQRIDFLCMKLDQWTHRISRTGGWVGAGVQPGESKPLCWWKDGDQIRVLKGDLTIVDADQPPSSK